MIPKKIHYCWFGKNQKSKLVRKCIASWHKYCSDYEIIEWNEDNFDIDKYVYSKYCAEKRQWSFLSDFVRLIIIKEHGGIYFDTDVEVIKRIDSLLYLDAFFGFENEKNIATGLGFGAIPNHLTVNSMLNEYIAMYNRRSDLYNLVACPALNTRALMKFGLVPNGKRQNIVGAEIFPIEFFNPFDDPTGRLKISPNTYSIHWYAKSWVSPRNVLRSKITRPIHRIFGVDALSFLRSK